MGGPDGGDGGKGGDIILVGDNSKNTLLDLSFKQHQHAENGKNGGGSGKHGRNGKDLRIPVPLGTVAKLDETGEVKGRKVGLQTKQNIIDFYNG